MARKIEGESMIIVGDKTIKIENPPIVVIDSKTMKIKEVVNVLRR